MPPNALDELRAETTRMLAAQRKRLARRADAIRGDLLRIDDARELARIAALATPTIATVRARHPKRPRLRLHDRHAARDRARPGARAARLARKNFLERAPLEERSARRARSPRRSRRAQSRRSTRILAESPRRKPKKRSSRRAESEVSVAEKTRRQTEARTKPPYRTFRTARGVILVGRGAAKNDELTFHVAKPYHLWLHARGFPGAHVVVRLRRDKRARPIFSSTPRISPRISPTRAARRTVEVTYVRANSFANQKEARRAPSSSNARKSSRFVSTGAHGALAHVRSGSERVNVFADPVGRREMVCPSTMRDATPAPPAPCSTRCADSSEPFRGSDADRRSAAAVSA